VLAYRPMPDSRLAVSLRAAREATIARLSDAFARDDLDVDEFERRVSLAHRAHEASELEPLVGDLPAKMPSLDDPPVATTAIVVRASGTGRPSQNFVAVLGGADRRGRWSVPQKIRAFAIMGGVSLDFREAEVGPGVTEVHVVTVMGGVDIVVPPGLAVDMNGFAIMGGFEHLDRTSPELDPSAPVLRITGIALMGGVSVSTRLPGESAWQARKRERQERKAARSSAVANRQLPGK
jgi:hypothetical protein